MKKLKNLLQRRGALPAACYLLALLLWLVQGTANYGSDAVARAQGQLAETTLPLTDWQLVQLEPAEQAEDAVQLTTTGGDPQIILENIGDTVVRTVSYTADFDGDAREMCLYYTTKVGEDYSQDRRVFPQNLGNGQYLYTLPRVSVAALRIDPCSPDQNKTVTMALQGGTICLNAALPAVWQYFVPSWYQLFCLLLYPALLAAALDWLRSAVRVLRKKDKQ